MRVFCVTAAGQVEALLVELERQLAASAQAADASTGGGAHRITITMVSVIARTLPGTDLTAAQSHLDQASDRMWNSFGGGPGGPAAQMIAAIGGGPAKLLPLQEYLAGDLRLTLWLLFGAVGLVMLIGCVNLANLQFARATDRRHELAIRTALGASRRQLSLGLFAENLLPSLLGGLLGILLSFWGIQFVTALLADQLPRVSEVSIDWWVSGFTLLIALGTGLLFGLVPVWQIRRLDPSDALHTGDRTGQGSPCLLYTSPSPRDRG